jgi:UDP-galactopyranose mutase
MNKKIKTDVLIIGSGLYGSVLAERIANKLNKKIIILEIKRSYWR